MINFSGESLREKQKTYFTFNNFIPKVVPFIR